MVVATQSAAMGSQSKAGTAHAKSKARSKEDQAIHQAFAVIDKDESGELDRHELRELCLELGHQMTTDEITQMLTAMDKTGSNTVTLDEFAMWWEDSRTNGEYIGNFNTNSIKAVLPNAASIFYHLFEDPGWFDTMGHAGKPFKLAAVCIMLAMNTLIIVSTFAFCLESLPKYSADVETRAWYLSEDDPVAEAAKWETRWLYIEVVCVILFTVDLCVRFGASFPAGTAGTFITDAMNWVDFFAIFPFYVKMMTDDFLDMRFLRVIRLSRVLRSIPSPRYQDVGRVVAELFMNALAPLFVPIYFMVLSMVALSSITYYSEATMSYECHQPDGTVVKDWDNTPVKNLGCLDEVGCECAGALYHYSVFDSTPRDSATFSSIPDTFWWCAVTFTTVGYGDVNPTTPIGKFVAACTMFIGIFFLAMPLAIIGGSFQQSWYKLDARAHQLEEEARRAEDDAAEEQALPEEEDDEYYQDELEAVAHLQGATQTLTQLMRRASRREPSTPTAGRGGKYDEVSRIVEQAAGLLQAMAQASEDDIIQKVQDALAEKAAEKAAAEKKAAAAADAAETGATTGPFLNPMAAEMVTSMDPTGAEGDSSTE